MSRSSGTGRFDTSSGTGRFERSTARYETLSAGAPELSGPWTAQSLVEVIGRLEHVKAVAYILVSDGLSEKCVFFPVGGLRLTSLGARRGTTLAEAIRRHPRFDATLAAELEDARREVAARAGSEDEGVVPVTLGESLSGDLREIAKECSRAIVFDELVDLIPWQGAEFEYRESNPPPAIFDAELEAVKLSLGVKKVLAEVQDRVKDWRGVRDKVGHPNQSRVRALGQAPRGDAPASAIVAATKIDSENGCTVDEAIRAARSAGVDAVSAAQTLVDLVKKGLISLELHPRLPEAVKSRQARGRINAIEGAIEQLINQLAARRKLAEQYEAVGDKEKAVENYRHVGEALQERDDHEGAIGVYNRVLEMDPNAFFAREQVGRMFEMLKRTPEAVREWLKLARQYAKFNLFNRAQDRLKRALQLDPQNIDLRRYLIDVLLAGGNKVEAAKQYQELARQAEAQNRPQDALACYQQIAELQPDNEQALAQLQAAARRGPLYFVPYVVLAASFLALVVGSWWVFTRYQAITAFDLARTQAVDLAREKEFTPAKRVLDEFAAAHTFDPGRVDQVRAAVQALEDYEAREHYLIGQEEEEAQKIRAARETYKKVQRMFPDTPWGGPEHAGKRLARIDEMIAEAKRMAASVEELAAGQKFAEAFSRGRELLAQYPWSEAAQGLELPLRIETVPPDALVEVLVKDQVERLKRRTPTEAIQTVAQPFKLRIVLGGYERITLEIDLQAGTVGVVEGQLDVPKQLTSPLKVVLPKQLRWSKATLGPLVTGPAVDNGDVVLASSDQRVYRLDAQGRIKWRAPVGKGGKVRIDRFDMFRQVESPPIRAANRVVVAERSGAVRGLDLETGEVVWDRPRTPIKGRDLATVGALGRDGPVILATRKRVIALDPKTGRDAWKRRVKLPGRLVGRMTIDQRRGNILGLTSDGRMLVISGKTGKMFKPTTVGGRPVGAPVAAPGGALVVTESKRLVYLWNKVKWDKPLPEIARSAPLYANKVVYVPCGKTLLALRLKDGHELWRKAFDAPLTTPAFGGNRLYVGLRDGRVFALVPDSGDVRWVFATRDELRTPPQVEEGTVFVASTDFTLYAIKDDD